VTNTLRFLRRRTTSALLIVYCLYHSLSMVRSSSRDYLNSTGPDPITVWEKRFEVLKAQLSRQGYSNVGYITDMPEVADWFTEYFQTQYAFAPIVVDNSTDGPLVVANLHDPSSIERIIRERRLIPVEDYGNGVLLLSKEAH